MYTMLYVNYISVKRQGEGGGGRDKEKQRFFFFTVFSLLKIKPPRKTVNTVILLHNTEKKMTKFMLASRKDRLHSSAPTTGSYKLVITDSLVGVKNLMPPLPTTLAGKPGRVTGHCQGLGVAERKNTVMRFRNPKWMAFKQATQLLRVTKEGSFKL